MKTSARVLHLVVLATSAIGCSEPSPIAPTHAPSLLTARPQPGCEPPTVKAVFEFADRGTAEGVAVSHQGDVFVGKATSGSAQIWRAPGADFDRAARLADLGGGDLIGLDVDNRGNVYAAVAAFLDPQLHGLWKVRPNGTATRVGTLPASFASLPNDVTIDNRGNVYVSDSFDGKIWRLTPDGEWSVWIEADLLRAFFGEFEFGVNGLVYHRSALYAAITLSGRVIRVPIQHDGAAGTPAVLVQDAALIGVDGIELDVRGNIFVTNNFTSTVQLIHVDDLSIETLSGEGLSAPGSLAFNRNLGTLYVANLSTSAAFPRPYAPALVQMTFPTPVIACVASN